MMIVNSEGRTKEKMMKDFVNEMPGLRKSVGISQTTLGSKLGLSRQSISSIERREVPMTWTVYVAAVNYFGENKHGLELISEHRSYINQFMKS